VVDGDEHASTGDHVGRHQPGWYGVDVPRTGTTIRVKSVATTGFMQVEVAPK
jgi:immune inhibitor A